MLKRCVTMTDEDVGNFPASIIEAMMNWSYDNTGDNVTPIYEAQIGDYSANRFKAYNGYGQSYYPKNSNLDVQFYVPNQNDIQDDATPLQACYSPNTYTVLIFNKILKIVKFPIIL